MELKINKQQLFDDAGNSGLPFRSLKEEVWDFKQMSSQLLPGEVLVALYWPEHGENEDMKVSAIPDTEAFEELRKLSTKPSFLWQCLQALPMDVAKTIGAL